MLAFICSFTGVIIRFLQCNLFNFYDKLYFKSLLENKNKLSQIKWSAEAPKAQTSSMGGLASDELRGSNLEEEEMLASLHCPSLATHYTHTHTHREKNSKANSINVSLNTQHSLNSSKKLIFFQRD